MNLLVPIFEVVDILLGLYYWAIWIWVIMSWLVQFGVINRSNQLVRAVTSTLDQIIEPALRPIRRVLPIFGGLDLSPLVLVLIIYLIRRYLFIIEMRLS